MKTCPNCGNIIEDSNRFCNICGADLINVPIDFGSPPSYGGKKRGSARNVVLLVLACVMLVAAIVIGAFTFLKAPIKPETTPPPPTAQPTTPPTTTPTTTPTTPPTADTSTPSTPTPTTNTYASDLIARIAAYDPDLTLPNELALYPEDQVVTRYCQGEAGQGVALFDAPSNAKRIGTLEEGVEVTVYGAQEGRAIVRVVDGRYAWAPMDRLVVQFDAQLSYQRERNYIINSPSDWTNPTYYSFIMDHASDFPPEVVEAARAARGESTSGSTAGQTQSGTDASFLLNWNIFYAAVQSQSLLEEEHYYDVSIDYLSEGRIVEAAFYTRPLDASDYYTVWFYEYDSQRTMESVFTFLRYEGEEGTVIDCNGSFILLKSDWSSIYLFSGTYCCQLSSDRMENLSAFLSAVGLTNMF